MHSKFQFILDVTLFYIFFVAVISSVASTGIGWSGKLFDSNVLHKNYSPVMVGYSGNHKTTKEK